MIFWSITLIMLAAAVFCILLPLSGAFGGGKTQINAESFYRHQLEDIDTQIATSPAKADILAEERAEVARRYLKEVDRNGDKASATTTSKPRLVASLFTLLIVPAVSFTLYIRTGSPGIPDAPLAARQGLPLEQRSVQEVVQLAEKHLAKNPDDPRGWTLLAQVYQRLNAPRKRANAIEQLIRIEGSSPELSVELAETLTRIDGNVVPSRAKTMFVNALKANPSLHKARFYIAVALGQEGRNQEAVAQWNLLAQIRLDDPVWQRTISKELSKSRQAAGLPPLKGPTSEDIAAAAGQSAAERSEMIRGMVDGLASKLKENPDDLAGWQRLVRSYTVLKMPNEAIVAMTFAKQHFSDKPDALSQLTQLESVLGLNSEVKQ